MENLSERLFKRYKFISQFEPPISNHYPARDSEIRRQPIINFIFTFQIRQANATKKCVRAIISLIITKNKIQNKKRNILINIHIIK